MKNLKITLDHYVPTWVAEKAISKPYATAPTEGRLERVVRVNKHKSVAEFLGYWWSIEGFSRLVLQDMVRHRIASYCVESTRFTTNKFVKKWQEGKLDIDDLFVTPYINGKRDEDLYQLQKTQVESFLYNASNLFAKGYTNDQVKYILPESWRVNAAVYMNARSFENFIGLRLDRHVHFELREIARRMVHLIPDDQRFIIADIVANRGELL